MATFPPHTLSLPLVTKHWQQVEGWTAQPEPWQDARGWDWPGQCCSSTCGGRGVFVPHPNSAPPAAVRPCVTTLHQSELQLHMFMKHHV